MEVDPELCVVVFAAKKLLGKTNSTQGVPTRIENGIEEAWKMAVEQDNLKAGKVVEIFSEWSATPTDVEFLKSTFPDVPFSYQFTRPKSDEGWDAAFAEVRQELESQADGSGGGLDFEPMILPVLRNNDSENVLTSSMVHIPLGNSGLVAALANVAPTSHGTIGADWVMKSSVDEDKVDEIFEQALMNVQAGLKINGGKAESGETFVVVEHNAYHGASALCLPGFLDQATEWTGSANLFVGVPNPELLLITGWDSPSKEKFRDDVLASECLKGQPLSPCCFQFVEGRLKREATHPNGVWEGL